jgi:predicted phage-related endonuclease
MNDAEKAAWLASRCGNLNGSRTAEMLDFTAKGAEGAKRKALKIEILAERLTGDAVPHFVNQFMQWGLEQEPHAKSAYELATGQMLLPCGYILHPTIECYGSTPDSLIGSDAIAEFKCPQTTTHLTWMLAGGVPDQHKPQILSQLACTGRTRAVFVSFDPRIKDERKRLFIAEWVPERAEIEAVEEAARKFLEEVEQMFQQLTEREAA